MNDLKGKVVLIDVWATWCAPCKVEIPHLKKMEEEFKGKDVAFVSISVDVEKDKEKWRMMVEKDQLGGTQLYAKGWSEITKYYDITGIPRFMVFDKEGKIVSPDSPRPSQPELKVMLEETLGNK
jgi:thiol-disulfide isomerase/thioredoxin